MLHSQMAPMSSSGWSRRARRARQPFGCPWVPPRPAERLVRRATVDIDLERKLVSERMRVARQTDIELCVAAQTAAAARRELGSIAHLLLRRRAYRRLGFVRLSDYARERLGVSARTVQAAAWLAKRLD